MAVETPVFDPTMIPVDPEGPRAHEDVQEAIEEFRRCGIVLCATPRVADAVEIEAWRTGLPWRRYTHPRGEVICRPGVYWRPMAEAEMERERLRQLRDHCVQCVQAWRGFAQRLADQGEGVAAGAVRGITESLAIALRALGFLGDGERPPVGAGDRQS